MKLTNQEAIEQLKLNNPFMAGKFSQAIDKGIEALENQKSVIEELEKIKAEISDYAVVDDSKSIKRGFEIMQGIVLELLDNHISELKGENNE